MKLIFLLKSFKEFVIRKFVSHSYFDEVNRYEWE